MQVTLLGSRRAGEMIDVLPEIARQMLEDGRARATPEVRDRLGLPQKVESKRRRKKKRRDNS